MYSVGVKPNYCIDFLKEIKICNSVALSIISVHVIIRDDLEHTNDVMGCGARCECTQKSSHQHASHLRQGGTALTIVYSISIMTYNGFGHHC